MTVHVRVQQWKWKWIFFIFLSCESCISLISNRFYLFVCVLFWLVRRMCSFVFTILCWLCSLNVTIALTLTDSAGKTGTLQLVVPKYQLCDVIHFAEEQSVLLNHWLVYAWRMPVTEKVSPAKSAQPVLFLKVFFLFVIDTYVLQNE